MKKPAKLWLKLLKLKEIRRELTPYEYRFVRDMMKYLNPYNPYEELSEDQIKFINQLHWRYIEED